MCLYILGSTVHVVHNKRVEDPPPSKFTDINLSLLQTMVKFALVKDNVRKTTTVSFILNNVSGVAKTGDNLVLVCQRLRK